MNWDFKNAKELIELCEKNGVPVSEVMIRREMQLGEIRRSALIERIDRLKHRIAGPAAGFVDEDSYECGAIDALTDARNYALEAPTIGDWISVTDQMPEEEGEYIAFDGETVFGAYYEIGISGPNWTDATEGYCDFKVTPWMPLPEPPKEGEGDSKEE